MLMSSDTINYEINQNNNNININENINNNKTNHSKNKTNSIFNMSNNSYISQPFNNKNKNYFNEENVQMECICDNKNYSSKKELIQCVLCHKYQHLSCIYQAQFTMPYLCFNCQFKNNHFYLKWKKTILPAREIIYKKKWEEDKELLKEGTKKFDFYLNLNELNSLYNNDSNNSHYLAILCLTNNGKPFHLGFPDNINIQINNKPFYFTENKGFKRPLLIALDNTPFYVPKKRHLITSDKYDIPNANDFFNSPKNTFSNQNKYIQKVTISFVDLLENYRGSEFEFVDVRHYLIYIGLFQELKIPQLNILRNCNDLKQYFDIFKNLYYEKVIKLKWNNISNFITLGNDELNMNLISTVSNQKIIHPIRGLFCQHSDVLDYGECCGYITSNNQVYKCSKCNKPLNIMYIDDMSEKIFNKYRNENYSQIYFTNKFEFIRGEKLPDNKENNELYLKKNENEDDSYSDSFFEFYQQQQEFKDDINDNNKNNDNIHSINNDNNEIILLDSSSESNENENDYSDNLSQNHQDKDNSFNINNESLDNINESQINYNQNYDNIRGDSIIDNNNNNYNYNNNNNDENENENENFNEINKNNYNEEIIILDDDEEDEKENNNEKNNQRENELNYFNEINNNNNNNNKNDINREYNKINKNKILIDNSMMNNKKYNNDNNKNKFNKRKERQNIFGIYFPEKNNNENNEPIINEFINKKRNQPEELNKDNEDNKDNENNNQTGKESIIKKRKQNKLSKNIEKYPKKKSKKKKDENMNKNYINYNNEIKDINNKSNKSNSKDIFNDLNNYNFLKISGNNNIINYNINNNREKNINNVINYSISKYKNNAIRDYSDEINNYSEEKKNRSNSDLTSSSNSFINNDNIQNNNNNIFNNIYNNNKINNEKIIKNKKKKNNKMHYEKGEEKTEKINKNENENLFGGVSRPEEEKKIIEKKNKNESKLISLNKINDIDNNKNDSNMKKNKKKNKKDKKDKKEYEYETIMIDSKDLVEVRPYDEYIKEKAIYEEENEDEGFLNDYDIFESVLLNNRQNEFVNYDYYNIQKRLREYCSIRYQDDEIFNGNKSFFNKFN